VLPFYASCYQLVKMPAKLTTQLAISMYMCYNNNTVGIHIEYSHSRHLKQANKIPIIYSLKIRNQYL